MGEHIGRGRLVVVGTPIGNLEDLSPRAARALAEADVVAAEDTRRTRVLLDHIGVRVPMVSHHEHNEDERIPELLARVERGDVVAVVSDAGVPGLADPGFRLVRAAVERGLLVEAVPGPAAAIQALVLSGLPMERFVFEGFLPRKSSARRDRLAALAEEPRTLVFYVSPHRAADDLGAMAEAFGPERPAALGRELTKMHEEVWRGRLSELASRAADGVRGEATVVVAGAPPRERAELTEPELAGLMRERMAAGMSRKDAAAEVARETGLSKRLVYESGLAPPKAD